MKQRRRDPKLARLIAEIDFDSERYYNLYFEPEGISVPADLAGEAWANLTSISADQAKLRGEITRLRLAVEQLRLPAVEAIGLDQVVTQLRALEMRLKPLSELMSQPEDEGRFKRVLKDLLAVVDALDRVFELIDQQPGQISEGMERGLRSVYRLMSETLGRHGLEPLEVASAFDPHTQMAMGTEPNANVPDGAVSRVLLKGYKLHGQLFRTAQVVVAKNQPRPAADGTSGLPR